MKDYQKINTVFLRDKNNIIMVNEPLTMPEYEYLKNCKFEATEKIDGTNIHIDMVYAEDGTPMLEFHGRTEKAQIPPHLLKKLQTMFNIEQISSVFANAVENKIPVQIFGEGYGCKIQKGGNYISNDVSFIMFDIRVGEIWLLRDSMLEISEKLGIDTVPFMGYFTIDEAIEYVKKGFKSTIAENRDYDAEGLVLKTPYGLRTRMGERIVLKIKTKDFREYVAKYGDKFDAVQERNPLDNRK